MTARLQVIKEIGNVTSDINFFEECMRMRQVPKGFKKDTKMRWPKLGKRKWIGFWYAEKCKWITALPCFDCISRTHHYQGQRWPKYIGGKQLLLQEKIVWKKVIKFWAWRYIKVSFISRITIIFNVLHNAYFSAISNMKKKKNSLRSCEAVWK